MARSGDGRHFAGERKSPGPDDEAGPDRDWRQRILTGLRRRIPVIFALSGVAIAQPVLDLFGRNPEFFVAGRYSATQVVLFALVVSLVPAGLAAIVVLAGHLVHAKVGEIAYWLVAGAFGVLFAALLLRTLGLDGFWLVAIGALLLAGLLVWSDRKSESVHRLLSWVALGNAVFVGTFLFTSPASDLVFSRSTGDIGGSVDMPALQGPVVFLILDEFPVTTILDPDGSINEARYPNFARLAEGSTWFRNASARIAKTQYAAPALLSGVVPDEDQLPTHGDYPRNLFGLFGERYAIHRYETVTDMCPPSACTPPPRLPLRTALDDALVVYGHKVLPTSLSDDLPAVDHSWGDFDNGGAGPAEAAASLVTAEDPYGAWRNMDPAVRAARGQLQILEQMLGQVSAEPALHMAHVALPHYPWRLTPFGTSLTREFRNDLDPDDPAFEAKALQGYQVHSLQVGAADRAIGTMIDHLRAIDAWEDALVVVTSDHGTSLTPPDLGRRMTDNNVEELLRVPLFIKAPGQTQGELRDDVAQTVDVLPSIVDLLDARTNWEFGGHSLFDGSEASMEPVVDRDVEPLFELAARHAEDQPYGPGWDTLGAVGEFGALVGSSVAEQTVGDPSELSWMLDDQALFESLPALGNQVPLLLSGTVSGGDGRPPDVLVAINGTLAGVVGGYVEDGDRWQFTGVMSPFFRDGANVVAGYEPERTADGRVVVHPVGSG